MTGAFASSAPSIDRTGNERVHFSPGRTSRSVGCRSTARGGARSSLVSSGPSCPGRLARRYTERFEAALGAFGPRQARQMRWRSDLVPVLTSDDCWPWCSRTDLLLKPICDAIALGTFRTRLETRTKESSMYASHWESLNLKA